ncbi:MAG: sensor histidine kinase [Microbacteriaceae bacterium]
MHASRGGWDRHDLHWDATPPLRPPRAVTLWVPVVLAFLVQVPTAIVLTRTLGLDAATSALLIGISLVGPVALVAARRAPGPVVAITIVAAAVDLFLRAGDGPPYVAAVFAIIGAIARGARVWAFVSVAVAWAGSLAFALIVGADLNPARVAGITLGILIVMGAGEMMRSRRERFAEAQRLASERREAAVQAERVRIARELHDVLAHSLSQINVQAGVGLHLAERHPEKAADALSNIKETSKTALDEVRAVLGLLRSASGSDPEAPLVPQSGLDRLAALVDGVRSHDIEIILDDAVPPGAHVPASTQSAVYRIVQESLTNVIRHSGASSVRVSVSVDAGELVAEVIDDGHGTPSSSDTPSGGRGLLGMRERAELLGGHLDAGPAPSGGFRIHARIPIPERDSDERETP